MVIKKIAEISDNESKTKNIIKKSNEKNKKCKSFGDILREELKKGDEKYRN